MLKENSTTAQVKRSYNNVSCTLHVAVECDLTHSEIKQTILGSFASFFVQMLLWKKNLLCASRRIIE